MFSDALDDYRDRHWETSRRGQVRQLRKAVTEGYDFASLPPHRRPVLIVVSGRARRM